MAETRESIALKVFDVHKDSLQQAIEKIADFPRFLSRLYVKKVISGIGRNTVSLSEILGRRFQVVMLLNMIEGEIKALHESLLAFIRVLKKESLTKNLASKMEENFRFSLTFYLCKDNVNFDQDSEPESATAVSDELTKSKVHAAALNGCLRTVKKYIQEQGTDPWLRDENGNALVHYTAISGSIDLMEYLVKEHFCSPNSMGEGGTSPLHLAAQFNHLDLTRFLIDALEADPNFPDEDGNTPLHTAARSNAVHTVEFLLDYKKCNFMQKNQEGYNSIHMACLAENDDAFFIITRDALDTDLSSKNNEGMTPMHLVCQSGNTAILRYLIEHGCDHLCKDGYGRTPLHYACQNNKLDMVKYLVQEKAAGVNCKDRDGKTPLDLASDANHDEVATFLKSK